MIRRAISRIGRAATERLRGELSVDWYRARGSEIGRDVYIGRGSRLDSGFAQLISIGDDTIISSGVEILAHDASMKRQVGYTLIDKVTIGARVYVGAGVVILPGVVIGDDAVVGAGSVVTRSVEPGAVVAGNPARQINTTAALATKHAAQIDQRPRYPANGWTVGNGGISPANRQAMREALESGHGYIE